MSVLGFHSGGDPASAARLPGELSADTERAWSLEDWIVLPFEGVSEFLTHNIFVATICEERNRAVPANNLSKEHIAQIEKMVFLTQSSPAPFSGALPLVFPGTGETYS